MSIELVKPPGPHGRPIEIMLVEDNIGDVLLTQLAFQKAKLANNISVAHDGEEALSMLRRQAPYQDHPRPDLIFLDLNLPKLDGREVLTEIKNDPALLEIPVVILSGSPAESEIANSYALHANAYIVKPVNFDRLREIVATVEAFWFTVVSLPHTSKEAHRNAG